MQQETASTSVNTETTQQTPAQAHPHHHTGILFHHEPHQHQPRDVNTLHAAEQAAAGTNTKIALILTKGVGSMWTAYLFALIAVVGLFAILQVFNPIVVLLVAW